MSRGQGKKRQPTRRFIQIPHDVLEHPDFYEANARCHSLIIYLLRQYNGRNNGDLNVAFSQLKKLGYRSSDTIRASVEECIQRGLIIRTRDAKFQNPNAVCALYAVTWLGIDYCDRKLDVAHSIRPRRSFSIDRIRLTKPDRGVSSSQNMVRTRKRGKDGRFVAS